MDAPLTLISDAFHWVLRASLHGSIIILIVLLVQWLLGNRLAPAWRYGLWLLVVVRLLLPVAPSSSWSVFNAPTWVKDRVFQTHHASMEQREDNELTPIEVPERALAAVLQGKPALEEPLAADGDSRDFSSLA